MTVTLLRRIIGIKDFAVTLSLKSYTEFHGGHTEIHGEKIGERVFLIVFQGSWEQVHLTKFTLKIL